MRRFTHLTGRIQATGFLSWQRSQRQGRGLFEVELPLWEDADQLLLCIWFSTTALKIYGEPIVGPGRPIADVLAYSQYRTMSGTKS
jgi:hypothetical protein